jgi:hypothetical protein
MADIDDILLNPEDEELRRALGARRIQDQPEQEEESQIPGARRVSTEEVEEVLQPEGARPVSPEEITQIKYDSGLKENTSTLKAWANKLSVSNLVQTFGIVLADTPAFFNGLISAVTPNPEDAMAMFGPNADIPQINRDKSEQGMSPEAMGKRFEQGFSSLKTDIGTQDAKEFANLSMEMLKNLGDEAGQIVQKGFLTAEPSTFEAGVSFANQGDADQFVPNEVADYAGAFTSNVIQMGGIAGFMKAGGRFVPNPKAVVSDYYKLYTKIQEGKLKGDANASMDAVKDTIYKTKSEMIDDFKTSSKRVTDNTEQLKALAGVNDPNLQGQQLQAAIEQGLQQVIATDPAKAMEVQALQVAIVSAQDSMQRIQTLNNGLITFNAAEIPEGRQFDINA